MMCQLAGGTEWWRSGGPGTVCVCVDCRSQFRCLPDAVNKRMYRLLMMAHERQCVNFW